MWIKCALPSTDPKRKGEKEREMEKEGEKEREKINLEKLPNYSKLLSSAHVPGERKFKNVVTVYRSLYLQRSFNI